MIHKTSTSKLNKINEAMSDDAMLRQLGEESAELTHAVLKLLRTFDNENPTPVDTETAMLNVCEEIADVILCAEVFLADKLDGQIICDKIKADKLERWTGRLNGRK